MSRGGEMASPVTDATAAAAPGLLAGGAAPAELLPGPVWTAIEEIAGASGAWCPALSPEGDRVAYVTDRSGVPRLEVAAGRGAALPGGVPRPGRGVGPR